MLKWLEDHLLQLNLVDTMNQPEGFTRLGYSNEENQSIAAFEKIAKELGLEIKRDQAGNVIARWIGASEDLPAVAVGSHLDTVVSGGGYDGTAGVLCALGAVKQLKDEGYQPTHPIEVIVFRSEESARFGISTIGSKAMAGLLDLQIGSVKDSSGISIREAVATLGFNWDEFSKAERKKEELKCFLELHIEQGTVLEENQKDYGIVDGVACPIRLKVKVFGLAGHTGTSPMNGRRDALVAVAPLISYVSETATKLSEENSTPVVATVSTMEVKPNSINVIPGYVEVGIDIRSVEDSLKKIVEQSIREKCNELERLYHVSIEIEKLVDNPSVFLDERIQQQLKKVVSEMGSSYLMMNSGAGHDVMNMAKKWPSGLIFIPCKDGLSHHPAEHASLEDMRLGVNIIAGFLKKEAGGLNEKSTSGSSRA
jgi:hydantoinase/carbamoylase family amidase